jgi:hypothetical protein
MLLTDNETKVDLLNNEAIANTIVGLLREKPDRPVTVGVHGDWGAGKSSVLEMIEAALEPDTKVLCLKFNGWRFQGFEDAKIALLEAIVSEIAEKRGVAASLVHQVKALFSRIDWLKVAKKAGGLALSHGTALAAALSGHGELAHSIATATVTHQLVAAGEKIAPTLTAPDGSDGLLKPVEVKRVPEQIKEFRKEFEGLLQSAGIEQLVVLIDDLDRCLPETAIETLEAVRLFVFMARTGFVVAADEAMIEYAVRKHFPDLPDTTGPRDYARNYLEKLIQVPFRIPALGEAETRIYVTLLLVGAAVGDAEPEFAELIAAARERLRRPWKGERLDLTTVKKVLGQHASKADAALMLSDQIGPILATGTRGNPRQIKRFLNSLHLRHATAQARGFGEDVKLPVLAKLMLVERFESRLFDQIATFAAAAPDGRCTDLSALEGAAAPRHSPTVSSAKKSVPLKEAAKDEPAPKQSTESTVLSEWLASPRTLAWARVQPPLGDVDLRPYLFVAKDRKDFFGVSALGHLSSVVERLFGSKLAVQGADTDLKSLKPSEAGTVFNAVCERILASGAFGTEPEGIAGLVAMVKAHPTLQMQIVDFLERLPSDQVGAWIVKGWTGVIVETAAASRFEDFLGRLSVATRNPMVRAAIATLRVQKAPH